MAIQMAIALAAAFVVGALVFPQHVTWVVLTAFIVCSGNRGRADVLYKSGLRIAGATVGTLVASLGLAIVPAGHSGLQGPALVVVLLAIITVGLWLREWTYAAWAVVMTLVITLLQGAAVHVGAAVEAPQGSQLWIRILAIIVGAACGLLASWFVLPVRSEGVVRKRIAEALAALSAFAAAPDALTDHDLTFSLERLDEVGAPWVALERVTGWRKTQRKPGQWIDLVAECAKLVRAKLGWSGLRRPDDTGADSSATGSASTLAGSPLSAAHRRALGEARRTLRDPLAIGPALLAFRDELTADSRGV